MALFNWIRFTRPSVLTFRASAAAVLCLIAAMCARADSPNTKHSVSSSVAAEPSAAEAAPVPGGHAPTIVIGFLGGFVRHDDAIHSTVQVAQSLQKDYPAGVRIATFENRRLSDAHDLILHALGATRSNDLSVAQKQAARVILYGHSWGACAVVALARALKADGIPVLLTIQVDSVSKAGQNDALIPDNVSTAVNFYQDKGFIRGQQKISAADASRTQILGNFRYDYREKPIACPQYPWFTRVLMRSHIEIECDPQVWNRVEGLIREQLPSATAASPHPSGSVGGPGVSSSQ